MSILLAIPAICFLGFLKLFSSIWLFINVRVILFS